MSESPAASLARHLAAYATQTGGPLALWNGSGAALADSGLAFLARPLQKPPEAAWFRQTPTGKAWAAASLLDQLDAVVSDLPATPGPLDRHQFVLVVQWRRLLSKALVHHPSAANVPADLRHLAHKAWRTLLPLVRRHDVVLARLLEQAQENLRARADKLDETPFWIGLNDKDDELRLDAQMTRLLASRRTDRTPHDGFCEEAATWLREALLPAVNDVVQRNIGFCDDGLHRGGHPCSKCPEVAPERSFLLALDPPALLDRRIRGAMRGAEIESPEAPSTLRENLLWLSHTRFRKDGVYCVTHNEAPARIIDLQRMAAHWKTIEMPSMFEDLAPMDHIDGPRQALRALTRLLDGAVISPMAYDAQHLFIEAGWGSAEDYLTSYSQFPMIYDSALAVALARVDQRAAALLKAKLSRPPVSPLARRIRRTVVRRWTSPSDGVEHNIEILRATSVGKQKRCFYTLPYAATDPTIGDQRSRVGKGVLYNGELFWTPHVINFLANKTGGNGQPVYPWAREFCDWVGQLDAELNDDALFKAAVYSERLPQRLVAIARGDQAHLGSFSLQEDAAIVEFFVEQRAKKRLSATDWASLLQKLPGRSERGILKRFEELGKKYAFQHGYQAYAHSPWCRKFSASRRKQWIKEGCPQ